MKYLLLLLTLLISHLSVKAQKNIQVDVLVIGNNQAATSSAVQAALSGVSAALLMQGTNVHLPTSYNANATGLERLFYQKVYSNKSLPKSSLAIDEANAQSVFKNWADSTKKLQILKDLKIEKIEKSTSNWVIRLTSGKLIKSKILVVTDKQAFAGLPIKANVQKLNLLPTENQLYRTSVVGFSSNKKDYFASLYDFLGDTENLLTLNFEESNMELGQAAGAIAAYAAFFKTKTSLSNLKIIQGELLNYKLSLTPLKDVTPADTNWRAIQNVLLSGLLKPESTADGIIFNPEKDVLPEEIKLPLRAYYYKAQIWFEDHDQLPMTLENTISLFSYLGGYSVEGMKNQIIKSWKTGYQFKSEFDLKKQLNRREFAVLLNDYLKPINMGVDKTGRILH